jgi:predicted glycoside hydrolase/deacetylase ChbG (UPF0249 family)
MATTDGTLAQQLGFAADDRVAVVHTDDVGMCHAANVGSFRALREGVASCGSIMVPCPWFAEAALWAREEPELDLGVHLTLNSEWETYRWAPVAGRDSVPSLCAPDGRLLRASLETLKSAKPDEVETELRAQIETALEAGIDVTHIDSHMGTVFLPPFMDVYAKLAREFQLPAFLTRPKTSQVEGEMAEGLKRIFELCDEMQAEGFGVMDAFDADSLSFAPGEGEAHNRKRLAGLDTGVTYLICHPAAAGEELSAIAPEAHCRDFEANFYGGPDGAAALEAENIRTVGMRPLRDMLRS